jgi:hypothetical protein
MLAAGSGLYLYQVKQRAFALESQLTSTFHDIDVARDKTRMLRADWALMNDPERLQALADQYLALKPMAPSQLMTLDQLAAVLPPPEVPGTVHPPVPSATGAPGVPMAEATPAGSSAGAAAGQAVAMLQTSATAQTPTAQTPTAQAATTQTAADTAAPNTLPSANAIAVLPPPEAPVPPPEAPRVLAAAAAAAPAPVIAAVQQTILSHAARHEPRHLHAAAVTQRPSPIVPAVQNRVAHAEPAPPHHAASTPQYFAANEPIRSAPMPRIVPSAATVLYRPTASSLGMAGGAVLAPPRPLYSTTQ